MTDDLDKTRKRLIFRSWHRGTREMDLLMGRFADAHVREMDEEALDEYEAVLAQSDPDLYNWLSGRERTPEDARSSVMSQLLTHYKVKES